MDIVDVKSIDGSNYGETKRGKCFEMPVQWTYEKIYRLEFALFAPVLCSLFNERRIKYSRRRGLLCWKF